MVTDSNLSQLSPVEKAMESLDKFAVNYDVFDKVRIEPNNSR